MILRRICIALALMAAFGFAGQMDYEVEMEKEWFIKVHRECRFGLAGYQADLVSGALEYRHDFQDGTWIYMRSY